MLISDEVEFDFKGSPATMVVMRNSGHCWGRIYQGEAQYDVFVDEDYYDFDDEDALGAFIEAAKDPANVKQWHNQEATTKAATTPKGKKPKSASPRM